MTDEPPPRNFTIRHIWLKDLSFEMPVGHEVFIREWRPDYSVKLDMQIGSVGAKLWQVVLTATVTAKLDDSIIYLIEIQQAGVVKVADFERDEPLRRILAIDVPTLIFPYLREAVDNVAAKGGFPSPGLYLPDFNAWYARPSGPGKVTLVAASSQSAEAAPDDAAD